MKRRERTQRIASIGILSALSIAILYLIPPFAIIPAVPFLQHDFADVPIFIATFMYGPLTGLGITAVVCLVQGIGISFAQGSFAGIFMHFFATGSFVIVSGLIYKKFRTFKGALAALGAGIITWIIVMIPCNLVITPLFMGDVLKAGSIQEVWSIYLNQVHGVIGLLPLIIAFNVCKSLINSAVTLVLYKAMRVIFEKLLDQKSQKKVEAKQSIDEINLLDPKIVSENTATDEISTNEKVEDETSDSIKAKQVNHSTL